MAGNGVEPVGDTPNSNLYLSGIPVTWNEERLHNFFLPYGNVISTRLLSPINNASYVGALVRMSTIEEATNAKKALSGTVPPDGKHPIIVKFADTRTDKARKAAKAMPPFSNPETGYFNPGFSNATYQDQQETPNDNLYIRGVPLSWTEDNVRKFFSTYGTIVSLKVLNPLEGAACQSALVRMGSTAEAIAVKSAVNDTCPLGETMKMFVRFADTPQDKLRRKIGLAAGHCDSYYDDDAPNSNLYVKNVPLRWTENNVNATFARYGTVVSIRILTPFQGAQTQGALVLMSSVEEAITAKSALNGQLPAGDTCPLIIQYATTKEEKARRKANALMPEHQRFAPYPSRRTPPAYYDQYGPGGFEPAMYEPPYMVGGPVMDPYTGYPMQGVPVNGGGMPVMRPALGPPSQEWAPSVAPHQAFNGTHPPPGFIPGQHAHPRAAIPGVSTSPAKPQMSGPTTVCVTNLPSNADELLVIKRFSPYGAIVSSSVVPCGASSMAFVTFSDAKHAWAAVEGMNGQMVGPNQIRASIQIGVIT